MSDILKLTVDAEGIAELCWNDPARKVNVFSDQAISDFAGAVARICRYDGIRGVLITSGKPSFHAGADLAMVSGFSDMAVEDLWRLLTGIMQSFYRLETSGKPVAAAVNGHCLGGGFEMALAAHARFVADDPAIRLGLPEAALGLMPGFGGTQRLARLAPWQQVVDRILDGETFDPQTALSLGLVQAVVPREKLGSIARGWLRGRASASQPWAARGYRPPGLEPGFEAGFQALCAQISRDGTEGRPERRLIAEALYQGLQLPIEPALRLEMRRFIELVRLPGVCTAMRQRFFGEVDQEL